MRALLPFYMKRRLLNRSTLILNLLLFGLLGCLFHADRIVLTLNPALYEKPRLLVDSDLYLELSDLKAQEQFRLTLSEKKDLEVKDIRVTEEEERWILECLYEPDAFMKLNLESLLAQVVEQRSIRTAGEEVRQYLQTAAYKKTEYSVQTRSGGSDATAAFSVMTVIYFTALSFCTALAQEIVSEKAGHLSDQILLSVKARTHFLAHILVSWLIVMIQISAAMLQFLFWYSIRMAEDMGKGLIRLLYHLNLTSYASTDLKSLLFPSVAGSGARMMMVLLFLLTGLLLVQICVGVAGSYVHNAEEGAGIQAPVYLLLMVLYYLALSMNDPAGMRTKTAAVLSYLPFFSMIFMPCRILLNAASVYEILISLVINLALLWLVMDFGAVLYEKGLKSCVRKKSFEVLLKKIGKKDPGRN